MKSLAFVAFVGAATLFSSLPAAALPPGQSASDSIHTIIVVDCTTVGLFPPGVLLDHDCLLNIGPLSGPRPLPLAVGTDPNLP
jgi:hypothetical protein